MFIFAILGVQLFGEVKFGAELNEVRFFSCLTLPPILYGNSNAHITSQNANFQNFPNAMLTLFRVLTMADWVQIQWDCMVQPPYCDPNVDCGYLCLFLFSCCMSVQLELSLNRLRYSWAPIYFAGYILLGVYMMLNLFIVIMVDSFQAMCTLDESVSVLLCYY